MSPPDAERRPGGGTADSTDIEAGGPGTTVQPPADRNRERARNWARRELVALLDQPSRMCCCRGLPAADTALAWPDHDVFHDGRLDVPERERLGRELASAGFVP